MREPKNRAGASERERGGSAASRAAGGKEANRSRGRQGEQRDNKRGAGEDRGTVIVASVSPRKSVNMGHRWRCKCGYAERGVCARVCSCMCVGGRRISAFPAPGGGGNSESLGEGDPSGWPGRDRGSTIRRLLFLRRGRDRWGDCSRLEVSVLARSSVALPPPMFFFFAPLRTGELFPSRTHFNVLSCSVSFSSIIPPLS